MEPRPHDQQSPHDDDQPIEVTVVSGYLGAGKTTVVNHLLRTGTGRRTLVVVNDFGSIDIDRDLIVASEGGTMSLSNGCVCCTMSGTMQQMLLGIGARPDPPEHVLIEASGVSDPTAIARDVDLPGFRLDAVVTVVDAETIGARLTHPYLGRTIRTQVGAADVVVVNKTDLVEAQQRADIRAALLAVAPDAAVVETSEGRVAPAVLLGLHSGAPRALGTNEHSAPHAALHADHNTWSWEFDRPLDRTRIEQWVASLADDIVRVKGTLALTDEPMRRTVLQVVGHRVRLTPGDPWAGAAPRSRLVAIGLPTSSAPAAPPLPFAP